MSITKSDRISSGFTIVELLIVIVVIAILAVISIVAYNGVQSRAENTVTINGVTAYMKALALYAAEHGEYPTIALYPCMGNPTGNLCGRLSGSGGCSYSGGTNMNANFDADLAPYLGSSKPTISNQTMICTNGEVYRGAYVNKNDTNPKMLTFQVYLKNTTCPSTFGPARVTATGQSEELTRCVGMMPTL